MLDCHFIGLRSKSINYDNLRSTGRKIDPIKSINKNNRKNKKGEENTKIRESEPKNNEIDQSHASDSSLIDDKTFQVIKTDDNSCASSDNEASLSIDNFQPNRDEGSLSSEKIHMESTTLPDVVDFKGTPYLKFHIAFHMQHN